MGVETKTFRKKLLAASVSSCMLASASAVFAQSDEPTVVEEVQVFGIRAATEAAMDIKRDSNGVVDAISAEDIGKMPDANLAESLQRITGLSIDRTNGEGSRVTVRGIDPSLNMVTLNGRNMPAVTNDGNVGDTSSRAFDFANLASEVVNGVEVYKTGKADITSGGLGAVINIKTVRPLETGNQGSVGAKAVHDTTVDNGDGAAVTPEISGLYSWADDDSVFGVAIAASYQERDNTRSNVFVNQWKPETDLSVIPDTATIVNAPRGLFNLPSDLRYSLEDNTRTRTNGMLTLQFAPTDSITATVDAMYANYELEQDRSQQSTWYNYSAISHIEFDYSTVATPTIYQETYSGGKDVSFAQVGFTGETETTSLGLNLAWDITDSFSLMFDAHDSSAENTSSSIETGLNANIVVGNYADFSQEMPVMGIMINDSNPLQGNGNGFVDGGDMSGAIGTLRQAEQTTDIMQARLHGKFTINDSNVVSFGAETREDTNLTVVGDGEQTGRITMGNWGGIAPSAFGDDWPGFFTGRNFGDSFPDYDISTGDPMFLSSGLDTDIALITKRMEEMYELAQTATQVPDPDPDAEAGATIWVDASGNPTQVNPSNFNSFPDGQFKYNGLINLNREIVEEVNSFFVEYDAEFTIGDMEAGLVAGLRYEETDVTSYSDVANPVNLRWEEDNDWSQVLADTKSTVSRSASYDNLLPSLDLRINPSEDVVVRASISKTMGRAGYGDLRPDVALSNIYSKTANQGNPGLNPMESNNFDISMEYYYKDDSYLSVGYFSKDVSNFIGSAIVYSDWFGLGDVREGPRFTDAVTDIQALEDAGTNHPFREDADGNPVAWDADNEAHQHDMILLNQGEDPQDQSTTIYADENDPLLQWATATPVNDRDAEIYGFELALQHWFGESGFGTQLNYTAVNADVGFDVTKTSGQFALVGLSDSANASLFYDDNGIQARISYNWRDAFLDDRNHFNNEPSFTDAYYQLDFSLSVDITDSLTVSAEGLNITGENSRQYGRSYAQVWSLEDLGARYNLGVRYNF